MGKGGIGTCNGVRQERWQKGQTGQKGEGRMRQKRFAEDSDDENAEKIALTEYVEYDTSITVPRHT